MLDSYRGNVVIPVISVRQNEVLQVFLIINEHFAHFRL